MGGMSLPGQGCIVILSSGSGTEGTGKSLLKLVISQLKQNMNLRKIATVQLMTKYFTIYSSTIAILESLDYTISIFL